MEKPRSREWGFLVRQKFYEDLSGAAVLAKIFPPHLGIVGTVEHLRQFLLDLAQSVGSQLKGRLVNRRMLALFRETRIHVPQIGDFLAEAGEVFRDIRHLL